MDTEAPLPRAHTASILRRLFAPVATVLMVTATLAAACDGGGESATPTEPPSTPTPAITPVEGLPGTTIDLAEALPLLTIFGGDLDDFVEGFPALASGDFNDDGVDDLLIGASQGDGPDNSREDAGEAYVIFGDTAGSAEDTLDLADGAADVTIYGEKRGDNLGWTTLVADVNGDGVDDIIVGAPNVTGDVDPRTNQGRVYIIFGSRTLDSTYDLAEGAQDAAVTGSEGFSHVGTAVASGDVNGDGTADLILGAPFAGREPNTPPGSPRTQVGEVYVVFGSSSLSGHVRVHLDQQGFTMEGSQRQRQFGAAVGAGDVNGDGVDDIIVGAPRIDVDVEDGQRPFAGATYVFYGASDLAGRASIANDDQDLTVLGVEENGFFGFPTLPGDVNGDGVDDIVIGARQSAPDEDRFGAGQAYVVLGGSDLGGVLDIAKEEYDAVILGSEASQFLPVSMLVKDVNGDAVADIALGATSGVAVRSLSGAVYVVLGGSALPTRLDLASEDATITVVGAADEDRLGAAVALTEYKGENALMVLAPGADGPDEERANAGRVYLIALPR